MAGLFLDVLNMSISASWLILAVIVIRFFMGKVPKGLRYVLWALVGLRLLCPISIESALSMIPSAETFSEESMYSDTPEIHSGVTVVDKVVNPILSAQALGENEAGESDVSVDNQVKPGTTGEFGATDNSHTNITDDSNAFKNEANNIQNIIQIAAWIWMAGIVAMLIYSFVCYTRLKVTLRASMQQQDNLWVCDEIQTPFILGLIRPRIYMPSFIEENQIPYIVAHENEHLKYFDHWWKPLGFMILSLHWFNPLVWVAYILLCRDIELACDERVIQHMNMEEMKNYSKSLLLCSNARHIISACPVAFGEIGVKERIKSIVNYKKPAVWAAGVGVVVCVVIAICFLTNPEQDAGTSVDGTENTESVEDTEGAEGIENVTNSEDSSADNDVHGTPLDEELLTWFETKFFNDEENRMPNMFLTSEYHKPADIDLNRLFYDGANGMGNTSVSQKEIQLLEQRYGAMIDLDEVKTTVQEMNSILKKYTGLTLEETNKINISSLYYLEEYDAYYNVAGDTEYSRYDFVAGWINEDGTITLKYYDALSTLGESHQVTLREEDGNYYFVSNVGVKNKVVVDVSAEDSELTLMQKVLLNKASYNGTLWIGEVDGIYWSESNDDYWKYVNFFNVDLDRDGVDEVCVEYPPGLVLVFHEENGAVYGYEFDYRGFKHVYIDGTFRGSSSASNDFFCGNVQFQGYSGTDNGSWGYSYDCITSIEYDNLAGMIHYFKGHYSDKDKEITKEEYDQIMSNYSMNEVERYEFTAENILEYVESDVLVSGNIEQPQKPGTLPAVDTIAQPSQEKIGQEIEVGFHLYSEGTFVYYFNASTKSERLVLIEYPKESGKKEAELIVVEPNFGGWTGLRQALDGTFQAKLLAVKNISFEEGMYAHNATLPGSGMEKDFAEGEIVKNLDMLVNNNIEQVYVGAIYDEKPRSESGAVFIALSEEYVTILTNASDSASDALESNLEVYERIYERFGLTALVSCHEK